MPARNRGFTLIELLVVIAVIAVLVGLVLASLRGVRGAAGRAQSLGALRQIGVGFSQYTQDQNGQLLPGYIDAAQFANGQTFEKLEPRLPDGTVLAIPDRQSYVWRLAPYLANSWQSFFADLSDRGALSLFEADFGQGLYGPAASNSPNHNYTGNISERPAYGMNSIFVGGDSAHGGPLAARRPWRSNLAAVPKVAATRLSEVTNPSVLVVFAAAAKGNPALGSSDPYEEPQVGFCEVRAPFLDEASGQWALDQWIVGQLGTIETAQSAVFNDPPGGGLPIARLGGGLVPVVHLDASTASVKLADLAVTMRMWNALGIGPQGLTPD